MTWKDELRKIPAPEAPKDLLERILASRAAGVRVSLREATAATGRDRYVRYAAAIAAALAAVGWFNWEALKPTVVEDKLPPAWVIGGTPLFPSAAFGQERAPRISSPRYPLIQEIQPTRVHAGRWTYKGSTTADGVFTTTYGQPRTIVIAVGNSEGQPTWVVSSSMKMLDTVLVRVTGTERVTVPAGTFDCWRLEAREADDKAVLWVSQDQGWLVMRRHTSSDGSGRFRTEWVNETRLVAVDTTPPAP